MSRLHLASSASYSALVAFTACSFFWVSVARVHSSGEGLSRQTVVLSAGHQTPFAFTDGQSATVLPLAGIEPAT